MPSEFIQRAANEASLSPSDVEDLWEKAKGDVVDKYGIPEPPDNGTDESERFFRLAAARFRARAGLDEGSDAVVDLTEVRNELESVGLTEEAAEIER